MSRLSSKGVPSNRRTGGKKSTIDGPWNPPSSLAAALTICDAMWVNSVGSGFGTPTGVGATMGHERHPVGMRDAVTAFPRLNFRRPAQPSKDLPAS